MLFVQKIISALLAVIPISLLPSLNPPPVRIAIIGAGPTGLGFLKGLLDVPLSHRKHWQIDVFESKEAVGGFWLPDTNFTQADRQPETGLYPSLITFATTPTMCLPGNPLPPSTPLRAQHWHWLAYIQSIAKPLLPYIHHQHRVISSQWLEDSWSVEVAVKGAYSVHKTYDHLVVATGKLEVPYFPNLPGEAEWLDHGMGHRDIIHSKWFRTGESVKGREVVVVGGGLSGKEVAEGVIPFATKVFHSSSATQFVNLPPIRGTIPIPRLAGFGPSSLILSNGSLISTSNNTAVFYATGYRMSFPFLRDLDVIESPFPEWPIDSINHTLGHSRKYLRPLAYDMFPIQEYPLTALVFPFVGEPMLSLPNAYMRGLFVGHAIVLPEILKGKEQMGQELLDIEQKARQNSWDYFKTGRVSVPLRSFFDLLEDLLETLRTNSTIPLPPSVSGKKPFYHSLQHYGSCNALVLAAAWDQALRSEGQEFAEAFSKGAKTEDAYLASMERLAEWYEKWCEREGVALPNPRGLC